MNDQNGAGLLNRRSAELKLVSEDRSRCALSLERVRRVDQVLVADWGIEFYDGKTLEDLLSRTEVSGPVADYWQAHDRVAEALEANSDALANRLSAELHDALAHPAVLGPVTSSRRAFILDAVALAIGLAERLNLNGSILDVGCHTGFVTKLLARELGRATVGIDPSTRAIAEGQGHPIVDPKARLMVGGMPWDSGERFELVLAVDSMPEEATDMGQFLRGIGRVLDPSGVAIVVSKHWIDADVERLRVHLKAAQLGFAYADVVGGYLGLPPSFDTEGTVVLIKGGTQKFPHRIDAMMENEWPNFRDYANDPGTALREKTQAFERAARRVR